MGVIERKRFNVMQMRCVRSRCGVMHVDSVRELMLKVS